MQKVFEHGVLVGHYGKIFDRNGTSCRVFIARREQDIAMDRVKVAAEMERVAAILENRPRILVPR